MKLISIGVCCYNEEQNIEPMYRALTEQMANMTNYDYEIIFSDNASTDNSELILEEIVGKDPHVKAIINSANFGVERSSYNCMKSALGDAYIGIPCDFEEPPELIPEFIRLWEEGHQVVLGQKSQSEEGRLVYFCRKLYYGIIDLFAEKKQLAQVTGFGLYDRTALDIILSVKERDPYAHTRHHVVNYGFDIELIPYKHRMRPHGSSSYSLSSYLSFAISSLCDTSTKPLRLITLLGFFGFILAVFALVVCCILGTWNGVLLAFIGLVCFMQILCLGILGEYLATVLRKVTKQIPVVVKRRIVNDSVE